MGNEPKSLDNQTAEPVVLDKLLRELKFEPSREEARRDNSQKTFR